MSGGYALRLGQGIGGEGFVYPFHAARDWTERHAVAAARALTFLR